MDIQARFLEKAEYGRTWEVFTEAFGTEDKAFLNEFYGEIKADGSCTGTINCSVVAAIEADGRIVSSAQFIPVRVSPKNGGESYVVPYIMGVCTLKPYRHRGYMDKVLELILERLEKEKYPWCFLVPVDTAIYRHLGFTEDWHITEEELKRIYADGEGFETASAKRLQGNVFEPIEVIGFELEGNAD